MSRRRFGPICAFLGAWLLISIYFFGDIGNYRENRESLVEQVHRAPAIVPDTGKETVKKVAIVSDKRILIRSPSKSQKRTKKKRMSRQRKRKSMWLR